MLWLKAVNSEICMVVARFHLTTHTDEKEFLDIESFHSGKGVEIW